MLKNSLIQSNLYNYFIAQNYLEKNFITKMNIINNQERRTTVIISNINKELTSGLINVVLEKIYNKRRTYDAIYTLREKDDNINSGICYINFIKSEYIIDLLDNINIFNGRKECIFSWSDIQGEEFNNLMSEKKKTNIELDYIVFNDF